MKLLNILSITTMGILFAAGCSSTTVTNTGDVGTTEGGTDTGRADTGTGTTDTGRVDTGTAGDSATRTCEQCQTSECASELMACQATAAQAGCKALFDCIQACTTAACQNKCISDSMSSEGKAVVSCIISKCEAECTTSQMP